ncbi:amidohydrolase [Desulfoprunum benzoelyticum]|uniref:5-methylthioadenosine/S-adenosylhomocysteine deaminase n=1 Tax=Desulfoprunum benzoelyticum TaxID=1506996 RepID=A0A840UVY8_9BACT|nr:amidohydrolase [Desulfoprunum benzoelyticum]MBB5346878.1 5-methylthioadenosine/S-adenosylhomocysteine deaminase [Desulfoprunum benzoelyticum]MBM9529460.1 amidohydrolase [Desulfoprunum benzoelyticum]
MSTTLFTHCTLFPGAFSAVTDNAYILIEGNHIAAIGPMAQAPPPGAARVIDVRGKLVMPGLVNAHAHCAMTLFRGMADDLDLHTWLHGHIFPAEARCISPEMVYWATKLAAAEMILSGTTCVADAYFFSALSGRALGDCGLRAVIGHGIVDFSVPSVPDPAENIATVAAFIAEWQGKDPLITPAVFAHSPYTCSPATLIKSCRLAEEAGVRFFVHLAESRNEIDMIIDPRGTSPVRHLATLGLLGSNTVCVHGVWLDDDDLDLVGRSGTRIVTCPQSNMKLASGIARVPDMLRHGIAVGLGTDGCASNNSLDMFREMDMLAKIQKVAGGDATSLPAQAALHCATGGGATLLGLADIGRLEPGYRADLIVVDLHQPHLTPFYHPDLLVYAASGADVDSVMVDGRLLMAGRRILSFDVEEAKARVRKLASTAGSAN